MSKTVEVALSAAFSVGRRDSNGTGNDEYGLTRDCDVVVEFVFVFVGPAEPQTAG